MHQEYHSEFNTEKILRILKNYSKASKRFTVRISEDNKVILQSYKSKNPARGFSARSTLSPSQDDGGTDIRAVYRTNHIIFIIAAAVLCLIAAVIMIIYQFYLMIVFFVFLFFIFCTALKNTAAWNNAHIYLLDYITSKKVCNTKKTFLTASTQGDMLIKEFEHKDIDIYEFDDISDFDIFGDEDEDY